MLIFQVEHEAPNLKHQCAVDILRNTLVTNGWVYWETEGFIFFNRGRHPSVTAKWNWVMAEGVLSEAGLEITSVVG